ncbi:dynein regulatory complex subunit 7, partial [Menidia menidia]
ADPLWGLRVHCWVLVLGGSRGVQESFFIDALSGRSFPPPQPPLPGGGEPVEPPQLLRQHAGLQQGCSGMSWDLEDLRYWEPLLFGATSKDELIQEVLKRQESRMLSKIAPEDEEEQPRVFEMPRSWVSYPSISEKDLETRWPEGRRVTRYRKARLEQFAPCLNPDGLVTRLTTYRDLACTQVTEVKQWYKHRSDQLEEKHTHKMENFTAERFGCGRAFQLLSHRFGALGVGVERDMRFGSARGDNLVRRRLTDSEMEEFFEARLDFLCYRRTLFQQDAKTTEISGDITDLSSLKIQKVVERFSRDASKPANQDVAQQVFLVPHNLVELTFHLMEHRFIPSKRTFLMPDSASLFTQEMVSSFQVDLSEKPLETFTLHMMLTKLKAEEHRVAQQIHSSLSEVTEILACRQKEEKEVQLWTTSVAAAQGRREIKQRELLEAQEQSWLRQQQQDILAPLLIRLGNPDTLSQEEARELHRGALEELRTRLETRTQRLETRYQQETEELRAQQAQYQRRQQHLSGEKEEQHQESCSKTALQISALHSRLQRHKETLQDKYDSLDQKLRQDPRLAPHLEG